jgi:ABC-type polar amino acid transport system ATPase subunit
MDEGMIVEQGPRGFFETCSSPRTKDFLAAVL